MTMPKDPIKAQEYRITLSKILSGRKLSEEHKRKLQLSKLIKPTRYWLGKNRNSTEPQTTPWYQRNKEYAKQKRKIYRNALLEELAGRPKPKNCEVCAGTKRICFDHNHKTGEFRGWLCESCNVLIGFANDNVERLELLVQYLKKHKSMLTSTLRD